MTDNPYKINTPGRVVRRAPEPEKAKEAKLEKAAPTNLAKETGQEKCPDCGRELKHGYTHAKSNMRLADGEVVIRCNIVSDADSGMYAGGRLQNPRVRLVTGSGRD